MDTLPGSMARCGLRLTSASAAVHAPGGLLTMTMHPECIGRGHRVAMLEALIAECRKLDGVVFSRLDPVWNR
jgi:hypothetical protein